jgi:threonine dehydratase
MIVPAFSDILAARERLAGKAVRTPLLAAPLLSERLGATVFLKPECLQRTGSFKFRGAWNAVNALGSRAARGVVACSSGNHAQGLAEAARLAGIRCVIVMPADAPALKRRRTERSGARVVTYDRMSEDRDAIAQAICAEEGMAFVHPFNDPYVVAGQGTVGLEIADDVAALGAAPDIVLVPCSGGGLAAGVALAVTERFPRAAIYTAEPAGFDDYARSLAAGAPQTNEAVSGSVCDALLAPAPGAIGWAINKERLAGGVTASDAEALTALGFAFDEARLVVEPGGAVGLGALLAGRLPVAGRTVVVVLSGGNVADATLAEGLAAYRSGAEPGSGSAPESSSRNNRSSSIASSAG